MPKTTSSKRGAKKEDKVEIVDIVSDQEEQVSEPEPEPPKKTKSVGKKSSNVQEVTPSAQVTQAPTQVQQPKGKKSEPIVSDWNAMADDISVSDVHSESGEDEEDEAPRNTFRSGGRSDNNAGRNSNQSNPRNQKPSRYANSATNFPYQTYAELNVPVNELSNGDLVKILIVRSHAENQYDFNKTMKTVLRAMNLECPMPGTRPVIEGAQPYQQHQSYNTNTRPNNGGRGVSMQTQQSGGNPHYSKSQSMFGQRPQSRKSSDPHDF